MKRRVKLVSFFIVVAVVLCSLCLSWNVDPSDVDFRLEIARLFELLWCPWNRFRVGESCGRSDEVDSEESGARDPYAT